MVAGGCRGSVAECWRLSQRPWVRLPAAPPFFLSLCHFKGFQTVTSQIVCNLTISIGFLTVRESCPSDSPCCDSAHHPFMISTDLLWLSHHILYRSIDIYKAFCQYWLPGIKLRYWCSLLIPQFTFSVCTWRPSRSKCSTIAIYSATWNAQHHYLCFLSAETKYGATHTRHCERFLYTNKQSVSENILKGWAQRRKKEKVFLDKHWLRYGESGHEASGHIAPKSVPRSLNH